MDWLPPIEVLLILDGGKVRPRKELFFFQPDHSVLAYEVNEETRESKSLKHRRGLHEYKECGGKERMCVGETHERLRSYFLLEKRNLIFG
ncbi:hypothetical protein MLD38_009094 [Melastoma candidum]|uniref:Uncharacterized protein n=1 Tax=Melastoma candidum TaxID=119954 RepID=A0ACB9RXV4_9MYRT|nr:hypothetical protein MLD38_009094 [Melastoma candidum]